MYTHWDCGVPKTDHYFDGQHFAIVVKFCRKCNEQPHRLTTPTPLPHQCWTILTSAWITFLQLRTLTIPNHDLWTSKRVQNLLRVQNDTHSASIKWLIKHQIFSVFSLTHLRKYNIELVGVAKVISIPCVIYHQTLSLFEQSFFPLMETLILSSFRVKWNNSRLSQLDSFHQGGQGPSL